jgi:hypothetical protein
VKPFALGALSRIRQHVGRDVDTVDVEAGVQQRDQDAPGAAPDVERRLFRLHVRLQELGLRGIEPLLGQYRATSP